MTNDRIQMTKELAAEAMKQRARERQEKKSRGGAEGAGKCKCPWCLMPINKVRAEFTAILYSCDSATNNVLVSDGVLGLRFKNQP
mgnify:CR=1 FL=1